MRRRDFHFLAAVAGSLGVHFAMIGVGKHVQVGSPLPQAPARRSVAIDLNNLRIAPEPSPPTDSPLAPKPDEDIYHEDIGDEHGTGTGANDSPGDEPMKARLGDQPQAFLSRDPQGAGKVGDAPSPFTGPRGDGGRGGAAGAVAPPSAPPAQAAADSASADQAPSAPPPPSPLVSAEQRHDAPTPVLPKVAAPAPRLADVKAPAAHQPGESPVAPAAPEKTKAPQDERPRKLQYALLDPSPLPAATRAASPEQQSDSKLAPQTKLKTERAEKLTAPQLPPSAEPRLEVAMAPPAPDVPGVTDATSTQPPTPDARQLRPAESSQNNAAPQRPAPPAPATPQPPHASQPPTGDGIAPGQRAAPADPAPQSDSESDPFSKTQSAVWHNGKLSVRSGRKVKTRRPLILLGGLVDTFGLADPTVTLHVTTAADGTVTGAEVSKSSGSNDLDLPTRRVMFDWWFEPPRNAKGQPIPDDFFFSITFR